MSLALLSMIGWSIVDTISKVLVKKTGYFRRVFFLNSIGTVFLLLYALTSIQLPLISFQATLVTALTGILVTGIGSILYFKGMSMGDLSIVAPISSSWGFITALLALVFLGETLTLGEGISELVIFVGIILASITGTTSMSLNGRRLALGAKEAIAATLVWAFGFYLLKFVVEEVGPIWSLALTRIFGVVFLFLYGKATIKTFELSSRSVWLTLVLMSVLDVAAFICYVLGISSGLVSIVAPIASTYTAITFVLAYVFLAERLKKNQYIGIGMILTGILGLSVF